MTDSNNALKSVPPICFDQLPPFSACPLLLRRIHFKLCSADEAVAADPGGPHRLLRRRPQVVLD